MMCGTTCAIYKVLVIATVLISRNKYSFLPWYPLSQTTFFNGLSLNASVLHKKTEKQKKIIKSAIGVTFRISVLYSGKLNFGDNFLLSYTHQYRHKRIRTFHYLVHNLHKSPLDSHGVTATGVTVLVQCKSPQYLIGAAHLDTSATIQKIQRHIDDLFRNLEIFKMIF